MTINAKSLKPGQNKDHSFVLPFAPYDINTMNDRYRFVQPKDLTAPITGVWMWNQNTTIIEIKEQSTMLKSCFNYDIGALFEESRKKSDNIIEWLDSSIYEGYWLILIPADELSDKPSDNTDIDEPLPVVKRQSLTHPSIE